jgi:hypothetical protein
LEWILTQGHCASSHAKITELLKSYETFLRSTDESKKKLLDRFSNREQSLALFKSAKEFGDLVFDTLESIGSENRFYRVLVV